MSTPKGWRPAYVITVSPAGNILGAGPTSVPEAEPPRLCVAVSGGMATIYLPEKQAKP